VGPSHVARFPDGALGGFDDFLIEQTLASSSCTVAGFAGLTGRDESFHMDIFYLLLVLALFASALGFIRLCERVH
jgi:hypothetical protein